uniref:Cilia and flagella associated protein 68 n=1 Tax=Chrysemys picta bellii TaxID=8478 RepID=A0A8C3FTS7_CHRPI
LSPGPVPGPLKGPSSYCPRPTHQCPGRRSPGRTVSSRYDLPHFRRAASDVRRVSRLPWEQARLRLSKRRSVVASGPAGESAQQSGASSSRAARNVPPVTSSPRGQGAWSVTYGRVRVMSLSCFYNPHHGSLIHATGHAEVWTDWNSTSKFSQYGWRCTTNEDAYSNKTLMGNWNQERYDIRKITQPKLLPSQDLNKNLIGFLDTSLSWNPLRSNRLHGPAT